MAALIKIDHTLSQAATERNATARFCSRCGEPADDAPGGEAPAPRRRVCDACGMGLLLSCDRGALPGPGSAFLIVTADLRVSAVSESAEVLFRPEQELLGEFLGNLIASPSGEEHLARTAARAALRRREPETVTVRGLTPRARAVGTLTARISTCGPPRAALVTVDSNPFARR